MDLYTKLKNIYYSLATQYTEEEVKQALTDLLHEIDLNEHIATELSKSSTHE